MKNLIKFILQKLLGYQRYLFVFSKFKIKNLETDKKEGDFFAFMDAIEAEKEGDLLDVGANIGIMTVHLSKRFPERNITAIEPMPSNLQVLRRIIAHYRLKNVEVIEKAVGNRENEELKMILPQDGKVKMQGLAHIKHDSITEWNEGEEFLVISDTLDHIVGESPIAGIKMDIENYEFFALEGARNLLERDQPIVYLELWENENRDHCFNLLEGMGYKAYVRVEQELHEYDPSVHQKQNFIFKCQA